MVDMKLLLISWITIVILLIWNFHAHMFSLREWFYSLTAELTVVCTALVAVVEAFFLNANDQYLELIFCP